MKIANLFKEKIPKSFKIKQVLNSINSIDFIESMKIRDNYIQKYSFSLYSLEELQILSKLFGNQKVFEFGCGSGYLTSQMKLLGCNYIGIDNYQTKYNSNDKSFDNGNYFVIRENAIKYFTKRSKSSKFIVMSWPDYKSKFAYNIAKIMRKGSILIYKGEDFEGCTADDNFFNYIDSHFKLDKKLTDKLNKKSNSFYGIYDRWSVWKKIKGRK